MPSKSARSGAEQQDAAGLEGPLAKVMDLPEQEVLVERARRDDAPGRELGQRLLRLGEVADGAHVELLFARRMGDQERGERVVAQVLEEDPAARRVFAEDERHVDAARREQVAHLEEGPARGRSAGLADLLGLGAVGDEHADDGPAGHAPSVVAPRGGPAGHRLPGELACGARGKGAKDERVERAEIGCSGDGDVVSGRLAVKRTWQWGSRRAGPRGTTAGR